MRMLATCMQCQNELGHPSFEPIMVDYYDDGLALVECAADHKTEVLLGSPKFEMLLESALASRSSEAGQLAEIDHA